MTGTIWTPVLGWVGAVATALGLAFAVPSESGLLGRLPSVSGKRLHDQSHIALPQQLPSERTVAVVQFKKSQAAEAQGWIDGMGLHRSPGVAWLRLPVLNDPGDEPQRRAKEAQLLERYPSADERSRLVTVFTDKQAFVRSAGLTTSEHASVLVLDRSGNVLAKAEGPYDHGKAQALRETLLAQR
ncbi:MAG TPA: hypothetical protein VFE82_13845 [Ramlibacter sp.]|jgi:hypothetical protein|uniref:hypothetical protein n=1 Tax=Ramlibacter sp. TaxID=1917967 RepID=UPI002D4709E9|nr:hypothetical protein [Ramlibacter sp.]HZY19554.1 hypothetical protein [Ramlibacter sp.]